MAPLPGPGAAPRLLLLPASSPPQPCQASTSPPRKRQRLAHLSPEEKALRRKLKNRVAAQSARDRKKARMGELERQAVEMEAQNQKLLAENRLLRERTHSLALENQELRLRLGLPALEVGPHPEAAPAPVAALKMEMLEHPEEEEGDDDDSSSISTSIRVATGSAESAAGTGPAVACRGGGGEGSLRLDSDGFDSSDSESDLLLGILDSLDSDLFLRYSSTEAACLERLQQEVCGGQADSLPASPCSSLGPASPKLEAVNELIHFDHEYTKPFFLEIVPEGASQANVLVRIEEAAPPSPSEISVPCHQSPVSVKEEPVDILLPELGLTYLLSSDQRPPCLLDASSDSGYEGSPSPFSDLSSPLDAEYGWEEAFAKELFPQLISV